MRLVSSFAPHVYAGALACLPGIGPATLGRLVGSAEPGELWAGVIAGRIRRPPPGRPAGASPASSARLEWDVAARRLDLEAFEDRCARGGIGVTWLGDSRFPAALLEDPAPPGVLFWRGALDDVSQSAVAVVGTRRCTPDGRAIAFELGRDLAERGFCVVSGLALGIDGAAHQGALDAAAVSQAAGDGSRGITVGVAASGVDRPYPSRHAGLWERVARCGVVISETPPGWPAQAWRFPARNRVIAGLSRLVVVVESHAAGGSLITAAAATERGKDVLAVPGPVRSPASAGTNQLIYDGAGPARGSQDVLDALGLFRSPPASVEAGRRGKSGASRYGPAAEAPVEASGPGGQAPPSEAAGAVSAREAVLQALSFRPTSLNRVVGRCGLPVGEVWEVLEGLASAGVAREDGGWWSRVPGLGR